MFVAVSRSTVANEMTAETKDAFAHRPHLVDRAPGFVRMDIISPLDNPDEIVLLTYWNNKNSFKAWHRGHTFRESHRWIQKGLKLVPKSTNLSYFEFIGS
ncbi:MAG: antibiotic biosynthesis monooxygenase [Deltaproteobacteria bacterium]|nr:antibiotic biosynthesis monooxygenase [Deltaproteobacteria bacterium]